MTATPAPGTEPTRPAVDGTLAPTAPGQPPITQPLTRTQKTLTGVVVGAVLIIATLGFIGSYSAVTHLAIRKGFGEFAHAFPIAVDAGIIAFLALDLLLTWRRIGFPLLRYTAWGLTAATIAFNAVAAWPDPVGVSMHGVIPVLFVIAVEAARHAIGRIADITADKHLEGPNASRWLLNPAGTFILWRRQRLWKIRLWDTVLELERERRIYIGQLRGTYGRGWRRKATADQLLILQLSKDGMSVTEALALPAKEAEKQRAEEDRIKRNRERAEADRRRQAENERREQKEADEEQARRIEEERLELERKAIQVQQEKDEANRQKLLADAQTRADLAEIQRQQQENEAEADRRRQAAQDEDDRRRRNEQLEHTRLITAEQEKAARAAQVRRENEERARKEAEKKLDASTRAVEMLRRADSASAKQAAASRTTSPASASAAPATPAANTTTASASPAPANAPHPASANSPATNASPASASAATTSASTTNPIATDHVVATYQLLQEKDGKAPSDARLGEALGVSRSRAQQLRTQAINDGHPELAKPLRIAS
jgi:hypothetical protein